MENIVLYFIAALTAFGVTALTLPLLRKFVARFFMDVPNGLKKHISPTPVLGGTGIFIGVAVALLLIRFSTAFPTGTLHSLRGVLAGGFFIFLLGLADDLKKPNGVSVPVKLIVQGLAASALIYYGVEIRITDCPLITYPLTFFWLVGLTNAFNLLDISDGLCVSQAVICTLGLAVISLPSEYLYVNFAAVALLGSSLAFWPYNHAKKYKIFLGDSGAMFLGFMIAALSIGTDYSQHTNWGFLAPLFILAVPLFDTFFVSLARLIKGKNPLKGSNDHIALRLKRHGWKHRHILAAFMGGGIFFNILAFSLTYCCVQIAAALFLLCGVGLTLISLWLLSLKTE